MTCSCGHFFFASPTLFQASGLVLQFTPSVTTTHKPNRIGVLRRKLMNLALRTFGVTCVFFVIQLANFALGQPVKLSWDSASASGEVGYNVYRSNRAGVYTKPPLNGSKLLRTPAFTDSTAQTGQTYYYAITSV